MSEEFGERQKIVRQILVLGKMFKQVQGVPRVLIGLCPSGLFLMTFAMGGISRAPGCRGGIRAKSQVPGGQAAQDLRVKGGVWGWNVGDSPSRFRFLSLSPAAWIFMMQLQISLPLGTRFLEKPISGSRL